MYPRVYNSNPMFGAELLDEEFVNDIDDVLLIQHIRETGDMLHADALGSGEQHIGGWYNPAASQRRRAREEREELERRERMHEERKRAQAAKEAAYQETVRAAGAREPTYQEKLLAAQIKHRDAIERQKLEAEARAIEAKQARFRAELLERFNLENLSEERYWRIETERRCFEIAMRAAVHWDASDIDTKLMWNMLRYMNLGAGRGKQWDAQKFANDTFVPLDHVKHCYKLLRDRKL